MKVKLIPVKIDIVDDYKYGQVAMILDNPKIYSGILKLRRKWGIINFYETKNFINWFNKLGSKYSNFREDIYQLGKKFNLGTDFDEVIKKAIVCNEVIDKDFKFTYYLPIYDPHHPHDEYAVKYAIFLSPYSRKKDVLAVYDKFVKDFKYLKEKKKQELGHYFLPNFLKKISPDTRREIRIHRDFFWKNKNGESPMQIATEARKNDKIMLEPKEYIMTIKEGIRSYKKLLKSVF